MLARLALALALVASAAVALPPLQTFDCEMATVARDFYTQAPQHFTGCADRASGAFFDVDHTGIPDFHPRTGDYAEITGRVLGQTIKATAAHVTQRGAPHRDRRALGTRTALVLVLRFQKADGSFLGTGLTTPAQVTATALTVNNTLFGVFDSAVRKTHAGLWDECSYGKLGLAYDVDGQANDFAADYPGSNGDIFYVDVPSICVSGQQYCSRAYNQETTCGSAEFYGWPEYAMNKLEATVAGFSRNLWQHKIVIFPPGAGCNFIGQGNTACSSSFCYTWIPSTYAHQVQDYTHEMGHNLGLAHGGDNNQASGNAREYGDFSCAMGYCCSIRCYNAPHNAELGWLTPSLELNAANLADGQIYASQTLTSMSVSDTGAITVRTDWTSTPETFWIQFKTADAYDKYMSSSWRNNVQIKRWNGGGYELTLHYATLTTAGQTWTQGDLTIELNAIDLTAKTATVSIWRGTPGDPCTNVVCQPLDECHDAGVCDSNTGLCSNPNKADGTACNTGATCFDYQCQAGSCTFQGIFTDCCGNNDCELSEDCSSCAADCGACPFCGDGTCNGSEDCSTCPGDCGECPAVCGDNVCETTKGEDCSSCAADCGACPFCGDGTCNGSEDCSSCAADCGACPFCGDGSCNGQELCSTCESDCGVCPPECGDGVCNGNEDCNSCSADCISGNYGGAVCGDGICHTDSENCETCPSDCNGVLNGKPNNRWCCGAGSAYSISGCPSECGSGCSTEAPPQSSYCCGDATCDANFEDAANCDKDCFCGDGTCSPGEDCNSCASDCGACPVCGDNVCNGSEDCNSCPGDCGACPVCGDNVCNGSEDCSSCPGDCGACPFCGDNVCNNGEDCVSCPGDCGVCPCLPLGASCSADSECCGNKCRGRSCK